MTRDELDELERCGYERRGELLREYAPDLIRAARAVEAMERHKMDVLPMSEGWIVNMGDDGHYRGATATDAILAAAAWLEERENRDE